LIDKTNVEKSQPPTVDMPLDNFTQDLRQDIQAAILLRPSFQTLQTRSHLAYVSRHFSQIFSEILYSPTHFFFRFQKVTQLDNELLKLCQSFYDEQFWQYQGYLALIANLDDYVRYSTLIKI
jgi:hypothetical protein